MKCLILCLILLPQIALGLDCPSAQDDIDPRPLLPTITEVARKNISLAIDSRGKNFPAETEAQKKKPILSKDLETCVLFAAYDSASAQLCKLEHEKVNYTPFMQWLRKQTMKSKATIEDDKKAAYAGLIHGIGYAAFTEAFKKQKAECNDEAKKALATRLSKIWRK